MHNDFGDNNDDRLNARQGNNNAKWFLCIALGQRQNTTEVSNQ